MLRYLLDEHISPVVAEQIAGKHPEIVVRSVPRWREGRLLGADDAILLQAAVKDNLTLVTYDLRTIPDLLVRFASEEITHPGVLFVDQRTIPANDVGRLVRALVQFWEQNGELDWRNRCAWLV